MYEVMSVGNWETLKSNVVGNLCCCRSFHGREYSNGTEFCRISKESHVTRGIFDHVQLKFASCLAPILQKTLLKNNEKFRTERKENEQLKTLLTSENLLHIFLPFKGCIIVSKSTSI